MNADEFHSWCQKLHLPVSTCKVISTIRTATPSRRVQGRAKNVSGVYPSQKMGLTIQFESHTVELWAIYCVEHDAQVLEFYDQPNPFKIQYQSRAYSIYDQGEHEALGTTPREAYVQGMSQAGEREHRHIPYSEEFLMATRPSTPRGEATVQPGKGIKVNYLYYWSDAFRNPEVERTKVPVRYDPFDIGVAYAYVQGRWVKCISQYYSIFEGRSEKELLLASQEIRQQGKLTRTSPSVSAKRLAEFIAKVQEHETLLLQRLRDIEGKQVQSALMNAEIETVTEPMPRSREETELVAASQANLSRAMEKELEIPPVDLSRLPVFGEYR